MSLESFDDENDNSYINIVVATAEFPCHITSPEEIRDLMTHTRLVLLDKYSAGVPFFSQDVFREVVRHFDNYRGQRDYKVLIKGLDGAIVEFPIYTGKEYASHPYGSEYACIMTKPRLAYRTFETLTSIKHITMFSPVRAYLPIEVVHSTEKRVIKNNTLVDPWPVTNYDAVRTRFKNERQQWEESNHFRKLRSILASTTILSNVKKIIAFSCSTMTWSDNELMPSMAQHALILLLRDLLVVNGNNEIKCFAQDPIYTDIDEQILYEFGITVLDDPRAFLEVDSSSIVVSISPDIPIRQIVADIARPALIIWDRVQHDQYDFPGTDSVSPRVRDMLQQSYIELEFPYESQCFGDLAIYSRSLKKTAENIED